MYITAYHTNKKKVDIILFFKYFMNFYFISNIGRFMLSRNSKMINIVLVSWFCRILNVQIQKFIVIA